MVLQGRLNESVPTPTQLKLDRPNKLWLLSVIEAKSKPIDQSILGGSGARNQMLGFYRIH